MMDRIILKTDLPIVQHDKLNSMVKKRHLKDFTRTLLTAFVEGKIEALPEFKKHLK